MKKFFKFILLFGIILALVLTGVIYQSMQWMKYENPKEISVELNRGVSLRQVTRILSEKKIIPDELFFEIYVRLNQAETQIKAGEYIFPEKANPSQVFQILIRGQVQYLSFTIPEGYNLSQIGKLFIEKELESLESWNQKIRDRYLLEELRIPSTSLEGYLFPDTYYYTKYDNSDDLIKMMVENFWKNIDEEDLKLAQEKGFSLNQWVTLASIIEKETGAWFERPLIASVFLNRMKIGMKLQTDPTVIYGIPNFDGNLTRKHLKTDHPYNTYTRMGLPPTPISSPGKDALRSVLNPAPKDYLYFVSKGDGTHYFSKTLKQHNRAVRYYQLKRGSPPPEI